MFLLCVVQSTEQFIIIEKMYQLRQGPVTRFQLGQVDKYQFCQLLRLVTLSSSASIGILISGDMPQSLWLNWPSVTPANGPFLSISFCYTNKLGNVNRIPNTTLKLINFQYVDVGHWEIQRATVSKLDELTKLSQSSISQSKIVQSCMHHYFSASQQHYWSFFSHSDRSVVA